MQNLRCCVCSIMQGLFLLNGWQFITTPDCQPSGTASYETPIRLRQFMSDISEGVQISPEVCSAVFVCQALAERKVKDDS